ncbi:Svf1-like-domain-containing protein [Chytriomyces sp. MP71]|nr:Svf1-like-domain-containing protein [Chytriomyces sp. MP71]
MHRARRATQLFEFVALQSAINFKNLAPATLAIHLYRALLPKIRQSHDTMLSNWTLKNSAVSTKPLPTKQDSGVDATFSRSDALPAVHTKATDEDLAWKCPSSGASETMTFYMTFDDGVIAFVQMAYSSLGLSPNIGVTHRIYTPSGAKHGKTFNQSSSAFRLSNNNLNATCEPMTISFDRTTRIYHVTFILSKEVQLDVAFTPSPEHDFFKVGEGKVLFGRTDKEGSVSACFLPRADLSGTVTVDGVSREATGKGLFHHAVQVKPQAAARWNFVDVQGAAVAVMLYEFEMPSAARTVSQGCLVLDGRLVAVTTDNRAVHLASARDAKSGYDYPTRMLVSLRGTTLDDGRACEVTLETDLTHRLDVIDVLAELPYLLRKFIQTFVTAPFLFSWFEKRVNVEVRIGDEVQNAVGDAFVECSFLSKE